MATALRQPMTLEQFLDWEDRQELRFEFDGFQPVAMTGGTARHEAIGTRLRATLFQELQGKRCSVWGPNSKIETAGRIRYPDAFVSCTRPRPEATIVPDPVVVFEILSAGTSRTDRIEKLREYQATPSIQRYVTPEQDSAAATVFSRASGGWTANVLIEEDILEMPEIEARLPIREIYLDVELDGPA